MKTATEFKTRNKEAFYNIYDMLDAAKNMKQLERAVEKSMGMMSQYSMDEIQRSQIEAHANKKYENLIKKERQLKRQMIANKDRS